MLAPKLVDLLSRQVGPANILTHPAELLVYECDGLTFHRHPPEVVVFPRNTQDVAAVLALASENQIPFLARGAGTSLSGGAIPICGGILLEMSRLNRILEIDPLQQIAVVEPGVVNLELSAAAAAFGLYFAPDPSSQSACTIGGNVANNAGGPHCLKYGSTSLHVLAVEMVRPQGQILRFGTPQGYNPGYDLPGLFTGSEGTLGVATKVWVRLLPIPECCRTLMADFSDMTLACDAVSAVIASGILPAALEMMDQLSIQAVEDSVYSAGYPVDAAAVLLVEVDGLTVEAELETGQIQKILLENGARSVTIAQDEQERTRLWAGRKKAFGAMGRLAKNIYLLDTVVPRTQLTHVIQKVYKIAEEFQLPVVNVFHAGDGNLHPILLYNSEDPDELQRVLSASRKIVDISIEAGGTITGEHGIGLEKRDFLSHIFSEDDIEVMIRLRHIFDPDELSNPEKLLPTSKMCMEFKEAAQS